MVRFELLEHTADMAVRIYGQDLQELFANAACAMFCQLADVELLTPCLQRQVYAEGMDYESVLVNWLNELLYLHEMQSEAYSAFDIGDLSPRHLHAVVRGVPCVEPQMMIKAATFNDLAIQHTAEGYAVTVVFDV